MLKHAIMTKEEKQNKDFSYLYVREVCFQHIGTWVPGIKEHELGLFQVIRRQAFLHVGMKVVKENKRLGLEPGSPYSGLAKTE